MGKIENQNKREPGEDDGKNIQGRMKNKIDWQKWGAIAAIVIIPITVLFYLWQKPSTQQEGTINTINQIGDNTIVGTTQRGLSDAQKNILINALAKEPGKAGFITKIFDSEADQFASQLAQIFTTAGWKVSQTNKSLLDNFNGKINIFMTGAQSSNSTLIYHEFSIPSFDQANILYESIKPREGSFSGSLEPDTLYIEVGSQ